MKILAYSGAVIVFLLIYFISALIGGLVVIQTAGLLMRYHQIIGAEGSQWWLANGAPFVISIIAGAIGAYVASRTTAAIFRSIQLMPVALTFVAILILQWTGELIFGNLDWVSYARGVAMALAAAITAVEEGGHTR